MISIPLIDELRATRRKLAEQCGGDVDRYAEMLQHVSECYPAQYVHNPFVSETERVLRSDAEPAWPPAG